MVRNNTKIFLAGSQEKLILAIKDMVYNYSIYQKNSEMPTFNPKVP